MRTSNIDFNNVLKRKLAMNSIDGDSDAFNMYRVAKRSLQENMTTFNRDVEKFFNQCKNTRNANKYYTNCLSILERKSFDITSHFFSSSVSIKTFILDEN